MSHSTWNLCALIGASAMMLNAKVLQADDLGCGFLECNEGCLVFRSDGGMTYQFAEPPTLWRGAHRVHVTGTVDMECTPLCIASNGCIEAPSITPCYTTDEYFETGTDFAQGEFINLSAELEGLEIKSWSETKTADPPVLPYLWVACSQRGTVVRIATMDHYSPVDGRCVAAGEVLGQYLTEPDGCATYGPNPSRTTVDFDGDVWVANRNDIRDGSERYGHAVKIGSGLSFQWVDRNGNGLLDTSSGLADIRPWTNPDGVCTSGYFGLPGDPNAGDVAYAQDELILVYKVIEGTHTPMGTRTLAIDRFGTVWVGGSVNRWHQRLDGQNGASPIPGVQTACGGYGGLVDCDGYLWSARGNGSENELLRMRLPEQSCLSVSNSYGLAANLAGDVWNSRYTDNRDSKLNSAGQVLFATASTAPAAVWYRGVVVTPDDNDVWTAATGRDDVHIPPYAVTRHDNVGTLRKVIDLGPSGGFEPTGVAVDSRGFVWVTNKASDNVMRIDPNGGADGLGAVDVITSLGAGAFPYNYSDMTGVNLYHTISPAGVWTIVMDGGGAGTVWKGLSWTEVPGTGNVTVKARAADADYDLGSQVYVAVMNAADQPGLPVGRYLQVRVQLNAYCHDPNMPVVEDLLIEPCPAGAIVTADPADGIHDARRPHLRFDNSLSARQGIGSANTYTGGPEPITLTLENSGQPVVGAASEACWELCETGIEDVEQDPETGQPPFLNPNRFLSISETEPGKYEIFLDRPISAGHWTTISYLGDASGASTIEYACHPADVNADGFPRYDGGCQVPDDVAYWVDCCFQGECTPMYVTTVAIRIAAASGASLIWPGSRTSSEATTRSLMGGSARR